jgi:ornithine cyclodeaminase/alanine dehydrogenase-like protein (mu-crystallin family)
MIHITEAQCARLISHEMAFAAMTRALIAAASPTSSIFPVVLGHASDPQNRFTIKSGTDATGKQELPPELFHKAKLFCDLPEQSRRIGEFQHADATVQLTPIGDVLSGKARGRVSADDVTIFDSSGISLQDLYIAQAIIKAHMECQT